MLTFISFYFISFYFSFLLAVSLRLFLSCRLTHFLPIFRFCVPLEMSESLWFSDVSRRRGMAVLVIFGSINDGLIWLMVFPVYALWVHRRASGSRVFSGNIKWTRWPEMGRAQETNIGNKSKDTSSKKICSTEKDEKVL